MKTTRPDEEDQVYAAPRARLQETATPKASGRFWWACIFCGALPIVLYLFVFDDFPNLFDPDMFLPLMACWLTPVLWIFLPELRRSGLREISLKRFVAVLLGFPLMACMSFLLIMLGFGLIYTVAKFIDPSLFDGL